MHITEESMLEVGRGREATVYVKAERSKKTGKVELYAIRVLRERQTERLGAEHTLRLCMLPANPHVVRILQADPCMGLLLLEYVSGGTLADELVCGYVSEMRAEAVVMQVVRGLEHLHGHRLVHGDVSPSNVLLSESGECKLTDFFVEAGSRFSVCGTPAYMAPEAARGNVVQASDIWSVGCLMLALTRRPPWQEAEVYLEDGSVVDISCSGALLYHLACREIALRGPPEFAACGDSCKLPFFEVLVAIFTGVEGRLSASELLVQNKLC